MTTHQVPHEAVPEQRCRKCNTPDFLPHDEGGSLCTFCARFDTLVANSKKTRSNVATPELTLTRQQFIAWATTAPRECRYCKIPEKLIWHLGIKTQVGHQLRRLGIDRADNDGGYSVDNLRWSCFPCNKAKSNSFNEAEMAIIGPGIGQVWLSRLAAAGIEHDWHAPSDPQ